jgi:hypothetical protein
MSRIGSSGSFFGISMDCWRSIFFDSVFAKPASSRQMY